MTNTKTYKALSLAGAVTLILSFGSSAFANNLDSGFYNIANTEIHARISEKDARNLIKALLEREFYGFGYRARNIKKVDNQWVVTIKDRKDFVATAYVNDTTGNIDFSYRRHNRRN